jgi:hypothetical protein
VRTILLVRTDFAIAGSFADLAIQHQLGLLSKRRSWSGVADRSNPGFDGTTINRTQAFPLSAITYHHHLISRGYFSLG